MAINKDFLGQGWRFPPGFDVQNRKTLMTKDLASIITSLNVLMGTNMGERLMQPTYGTGINQYFFKNIDLGSATMIQSMITDAIADYEPRISTNAVVVDLGRITEGIMNITIDFTVKSTNTRNNIVFPFFLKEGNFVPQNLQ